LIKEKFVWHYKNSERSFTKMKLALVFILFVAKAVSAASVPRWCVESSAALTKCQSVQKALNDTLSCVLGTDEKDCYKKINNKVADIGVFDGGMIFQAGMEHNLKVIMSEKLSSGAAASTAYYAVAAVNASSGITLQTLKGKKSCHTGVGKTAGWLIPVGTLLRKSLMKCTSNDVYASVAAFFSASCAPGAKNVKYNPNKYGTTKLCSLCIGSGDKKCVRNSNEPYYNYGGAFQCLKDGAGDVAFVKQSTLMSLSTADQAKYKILCLDGTTAAPSQFPSCNLARVPTHAVLTRQDAPIADYQKVLSDADKMLGTGTTKSVKLYGDGLLFSKTTTGLEVVTPAKQPYEKYLGNAYYQDAKKVAGCKKTSSAVGLGLSLPLLLLISAIYSVFY